MSTPQQPTPPGWYPDVNAPGTERWWDGTAWTAHARQAPPAAAFGVPTATASMSPSTSTSDERTWALMAHLSALAAIFIGISFIGPLIIYFVKREDSPFVRAHAAAALNFNLSWMLWGFIVAIVGAILLLVVVGIFVLLALIPAALAWLVIVILATIKASKGEAPYNYPLTINFVS